ncbi:MAG TPA: helix-turn-helix transcriptional regulator [Moheibacter sp.]|nr:helix-turn-helix transcriptional regulator [Moheibacter sp.]
MLKLIQEMDTLEIRDFEQLSILSLYKSYLNKDLGLQKEEYQNIQDQLSYAKQIKDPDKRHDQISSAYNRLSMYYDFKNPDSLIYYLKKEFDELEKISEDTPEKKTKKYSSIALNNLNIGNFYLGVAQPQRLDLAEPYYQKVYNYKNTQPEIFNQLDMPILCGTGRFYLEKGNYSKSLELAEEVLTREKNKKNPTYRHYAYMLMADSFEGLNKPKEQAKYIKLYATLNDSLNKAVQQKTGQQFDRLVEKKEKENNAVVKMLLISGGILVGLLLLSGLILWRSKYKLKKEFNNLIEKLKTESLNQLTEDIESDEIETIPETSLDNQETEAGNGSKIQITDETVHNILQRLEKFEKSKTYLKKEISLGYLAAHLSTNTRYLSEIIKQHKGKSFNNYINGLKINYIALLLLKEPNYREYKISYLADMCGFSSRVVFTTTFKKETGVSPSYYIENLKNEQ